MTKRTHAHIQQSHDVPRLEPARRRDLAPVPAAAPQRRYSPRTRRYRPAIQAIQAPLTEALSGRRGKDAQQLARRARSLLLAGERELGCAGGARGPSVTAHLASWAWQHVTAARLGVLAAEAGLGTDRGLELQQQSQRAAGRAERAWTASVVAAGLLRGRQPAPDSQPDAPWLESEDEP